MPRSSSQSHQDSLLKLLNQQTAAGTGVEERMRTTPSIKEQSPVRDTPSPVRVFGSKENTPTPFQAESIPKAPSNTSNAPIFTYVNPFEQLSQSSPLNNQSQSKPNGRSSKRVAKSPSLADEESTPHKRLTTPGGEVLQSIETPQPEHSNDGRTRVEALMGIGAPSKDVETVTEALNEVGGQVHRQMEHALAEAERIEPEIKQEEVETTS